MPNLTADSPLPYRPARVLVAGVAGCGKTTLSGRIADVLDIRHTEIDALHHGPNWTPRPTFEADIAELTAAPSWVTEWQYTAVRPRLAARADLMVWLDYPYWRVTFPRVAQRTLRRRIRREPLWNGNVEPPLRTVLTDPEHIVRWSVNTRHKFDKLPEQLGTHAPHLPLVRLTSPGRAEAWLSGPLAASADGPGRTE